jgi:hypothetical protein
MAPRYSSSLFLRKEANSEKPVLMYHRFIIDPTDSNPRIEYLVASFSRHDHRSQTPSRLGRK